MLSIGRVMSNNVYASTLLVQPHRAVWGRVKLSYFPLYVQSREEGGKWTMESGSRPAAEVVVPYAALVMQVELLAGSELRHGAATQLERRGWALAIDPMEEIRYLKSSAREALLSMGSAEE